MRRNPDATKVEVFGGIVGRFTSLQKQLDSSYDEKTSLRDWLMTAVNLLLIQRHLEIEYPAQLSNVLTEMQIVFLISRKTLDILSYIKHRLKSYQTQTRCCTAVTRGKEEQHDGQLGYREVNKQVRVNERVEARQQLRGRNNCAPRGCAE